MYICAPVKGCTTTSSSTPTETATPLDDVTECSICQEVFVDPIVLPCVHTFCRKCIADWIRSGDAVVVVDAVRKTAACPLCRHDFTVPDGGGAAERLPKNGLVAKLLLARQLCSSVRREAASAARCDMCGAVRSEDGDDDETTAVAFCVDCQENMCPRCRDVHRSVAPTDEHRVEDLSSQRERYGGYSAQMSGRFRDRMRRDVAALAGRLADYDALLRAVDDSRAEFAERAAETERRIGDAAAALKALIDAHAGHLLDDIRRVESARAERLQLVRRRVAQNAAVVESYRKYVDEMAAVGSDDDVARQTGQLHVIFGEMMSVDDELDDGKSVDDAADVVERIEFEPSNWSDVLAGENLVGKIGMKYGRLGEIFVDRNRSNDSRLHRGRSTMCAGKTRSTAFAVICARR